jgi:hypothetical protein
MDAMIDRAVAETHLPTGNTGRLSARCDEGVLGVRAERTKALRARDEFVER